MMPFVVDDIHRVRGYVRAGASLRDAMILAHLARHWMWN